MKSNLTKFWLVLTTIALMSVVIFSLALTVASNEAHANSSNVANITTRTPVSGNSTTVITDKQDTWQYSAGMDGDGRLRIIVDFPHNTAVDIKNFDKTNRNLIQELQGEGLVSVTFNQPLAIADFKALSQQKALKVVGYTMRATDSSGVRFTIQGQPSVDGKEVVEQSNFDHIFAQIQQKSPTATFKGVITVYLKADKLQVQQLLADSRVFTVDVTGAVALQKVHTKLATTNSALTTQSLSSMNQALTTGNVVAHESVPLYWMMEDTGIVSK
jgi:hypothetical protein